jgi:hypothetical protein
MTNKMRQIHNIYCYKCSTCFGPSLPIIRSSELYVQPYGVISFQVLSSVGYIPGMVFRWWYSPVETPCLEYSRLKREPHKL